MMIPIYLQPPPLFFVGGAQEPINYITNFRLNKYSLSCLVFSEMVNLITSVIKTIDLLS